MAKRSHALIVSVKIGASEAILCGNWTLHFQQNVFVYTEIVSLSMISLFQSCVTFVRMERWQICDRKEMEIVSGFGSAVVEGRGIKLCIIEIDNQLARSESMQNSKTQRGNKHLCESSWTN